MIILIMWFIRRYIITSLLYNTTPIHCTPPSTAPPSAEYGQFSNEESLDLEFGSNEFLNVKGGLS